MLTMSSLVGIDSKATIEVEGRDGEIVTIHVLCHVMITRSHSRRDDGEPFFLDNKL